MSSACLTQTVLILSRQFSPLSISIISPLLSLVSPARAPLLNFDVLLACSLARSFVCSTTVVNRVDRGAHFHDTFIIHPSFLSFRRSVIRIRFVSLLGDIICVVSPPCLRLSTFPSCFFPRPSSSRNLPLSRYYRPLPTRQWLLYVCCTPFLPVMEHSRTELGIVEAPLRRESGTFFC